MTDIPLPRTHRAEGESDIPLPRRRPAVDRTEKPMDDREKQTPPPVTRKPSRVYAGGEMIFHLLLPSVSVLLGLSLLCGLLHYVSHNPHATDEPLLNFVVAVLFTGLGGLELRVWSRRLRQLSASAASEPAD